MQLSKLFTTFRVRLILTLSLIEMKIHLSESMGNGNLDNGNLKTLFHFHSIIS